MDYTPIRCIHVVFTLLVAHGAVINAILADVLKGKIGSGKTKLINSCISNIHFHQDRWRIIDFNQISHLSKCTMKQDTGAKSLFKHMGEEDKYNIYRDEIKVGKNGFLLGWSYILVIDCNFSDFIYIRYLEKILESIIN